MLGILIRRRTARAVRARIAEAELPARIAVCIESVTRATRLRRDEQLDVAAELASHFREGLAAGRGADELVRDFGEVKRSAREIRRAAIAKRGAVDRAVGAVALWSSRGLVAVLVWYFAWATVLHFRQPTISFDGIAAIESMRAKPGPEGRAVDLYIAAFADSTGRFDSDEFGNDLLAAENAIERAGYDAASLEEARARLAPLAARIATLRGVRERPVLAMPLRPTRGTEPAVSDFFWGDDQPDAFRDATLDTGLLGVLLPQLALLRSSGRLLATDAALAAIDGRSADFLADLEAMLTASAHAGEDNFLIGRLVECAMRTMAARTVVSAIENHAEAFDDATLVALRRLLDRNAVDIGPSFDAESMFVRDVLQRIYTDDGDGDGVLLASAALRWTQLAVVGDGRAMGGGLFDGDGVAATFVLSPAAAMIAPSRAEVSAHLAQHYARLRAASAMEDADAARAELTTIDRELEERNSEFYPISMLVPAMSRAAFVPRALRAETDAAIAAVELERFRRAEARWPRDLAELERFAGRTLGGAGGSAFAWRYAVVDGRPLLYDAGIDLIDDRAHGPAEHRPESEPLVALSAVAGDGALAVGASGNVTMRSAASIAFDSPLRPGCAMPREASTLSRDGDTIRVWWKSRACGPSRVVPACE